MLCPHCGLCLWSSIVCLAVIAKNGKTGELLTSDNYLRRCLASGEGIVSLGVRLSRCRTVCVCVCPPVRDFTHAALISAAKLMSLGQLSLPCTIAKMLKLENCGQVIITFSAA